MMAMFSAPLGRAWRAGLISLTLLTCLAPKLTRAQEVIFNEVLAGNTFIAPLAPDFPDYFPDYIEIYNAGGRDIDLGAEGWSITDDLKATNKFRFPVGLILPADSYLLVFCDTQDSTNFPGLPQSMNLHTGFSLNAKGGESLAIFKTAGRVLVSSMGFGIQVPGYSVGRYPGANVASPFTLNLPTPCGGLIPCDTNIPFTTFGNQFTLKINEWLQTNSMGDDWLEIFNPDTNIVDLSGLLFVDSNYGRTNLSPSPIRAITNLSYIGPQSFLRFWCDDLKSKGADHLDFSLSSGSSGQVPPSGILDEIFLVATDRATVIDHVNCTLFQQRNVSQGRVPDGADRITYFPNPSPEDSNFAPIPELNINELLSHTDPPLEDAVELQNVTSVPVDISYWWFSNDKSKPKKYQIPAGTVIAPGGFYVIYEYQWNSPSNPVERHFTFNSAHGDECYLFKSDVTGVIQGFRKGIQFGPAANGVSFGRYVTSDGNVEFVAMSDLSFGTSVRAGQDTNLISEFRTGRGATNPAPRLGPNVVPRMGPIVINEIYYKPPNVPLPGTTNLLDNSTNEFVELRNITSSNIALYYTLDAEHNDPSFVTNGWKVDGVIKYKFDYSSFPFLHPNEYALLVNFDPTTNAAVTMGWRSAFTPPVPDTVQLFGPYKGKLSNSGGSVELYRPDAPQTPPHPDAGFVPYILVERVKYSDRNPWPTNNAAGTLSVDGGGASLQRRYSYEFGNDPTNWFGEAPTPGYYNSPNHLEKPYLLTQPQDYNGSPGVLVPFSANARGTTPLAYQWYRNGAPIPSANSASFPVTASGNSAGVYWAVVSNPVGSTTSRVATLTVNCPFVLSEPTAAFGPAGGSSNVVASGFEACFWTVTNVTPWITVTSGTNFDGTGMLTYDVAPYSGVGLRKATLNLGGQSYSILQSGPDATRPKVAITAPGSGARSLTPVVTVKGTALDNVGVARVDVQLGSDPFIEAGRATSWQVAVTLNPGINWIRARSVDIVGNETYSAPRPLVYVVTLPVTLTQTGNGKISGVNDQQRLEIGRGYTLTAKPAVGFLFSNWTGTIISTPSPKLNFNMETGMTITANFVPNPFTPIKGVYNGLFYDPTPGGVHHTNSGAFKLSLTDRGTYSSLIRVAGKTYAASGAFDLDGMATNIVKRAGFASLEIVWSMNLHSAYNVIGTVNASDWPQPTQLSGDLAKYNTRTNPAPYAGRYTLILPGVDDDSGKPRGNGFGTVTVDGNGLAKFAGTLGDGTKVSQSVALSQNGGWALYAPLYATKGSILSWVGFDLNRATDDLHGLLSWVRPPIPSSKIYPLGFETESLLNGSLYHAPGPGGRILQITDGRLSLSGGNLTPPANNFVRLGINSVVTNASPNVVTVKFIPVTGLFTGTFIQAGTTRKISFSGAVHQKANFGSGCYLGTNETGRVTFEAAPVTP